jgi:hypothetical protein
MAMNLAIALLPFAVLALAACDPADVTPPPDRASPTAAALPPTAIPRPVTSREDLTGHWRVAGIDGAEVSGDMGIGVTIEETSLSYEPTCLGFVWHLTSQGEGRVDLARDSGGGPARAADGSLVSCLPAVTPAFGQLAEVLDAAVQVSTLASGGIEFSGGGRSAVLFRQ